MMEVTDLPMYTATDDWDGALRHRIEHTPNMELPIMRAPDAPSTVSRLAEDRAAYWEAFQLTMDIIRSFYSAIESGRQDLVADFIAKGLVSPDTTDYRGETPLLFAIRMNNLPMVSKLVSLGATVDGYGKIIEGISDHRYSSIVYPDRTPLQYAAFKGKLAMVRVLMEDYGANDALVAPDGAIALRLAAEQGHRDIVDYLPARRDGAWLRWKSAHEREMKRIRKALHAIKRFVEFFVWYVPKCLLYDIPKYTAKWAWERRRRFAGWCRRQMIEFPGRLKRGCKKAKNTIMEIPAFTKKMIQRLWKLLKKIPHGLKILGLWFWSVTKQAGNAVAHVVSRFASFLHTVVMAVVTFFKEISLKDIWDGFTYVLRAIGVELPKAVWAFIRGCFIMTFDALEAIFGGLARCMYYSGYAFFWLLRYIPTKLWECVEAIGRSGRRGYREGMAFLNPKRL